jgi:hypothetical protein
VTPEPSTHRSPLRRGLTRRVLTGLVAWAAGAATAVAVGLLALSLIGPGLGTPSAQPLANPLAGAVQDDPVTSGSPVPASGLTGSAPGAPAPARERLLTSTGGSTLARCTGVVAYLVSWSPAQGYRVAEVNRGPGREAEVIFQVDHQLAQVTMDVHCVAGIPQAHVERDLGGRDE